MILVLSKGALYTDERAKKFIIPKDPIGASIIGFTIRKEDKDKYKNISDFAKQKGKLVPISPQNAQWNVIKDYNDKHKDQPIELTSAESFQVSDAYHGSWKIVMMLILILNCLLKKL